MQDANRINITICGDGGCGKSSITLRLVRSQWTHDYDPTIAPQHAKSYPSSQLHLKHQENRNKSNNLLSSSPKTEDSYSVTRTVDGTPYLLSLTDTAGQEEYRSLWAASNLRSDAFLFVYDITNPDSLYTTLPYYLRLVDFEAEQRIEDARNAGSGADGGGGGGGRRLRLPPPVKIVAGNKCDLKDDRRVSAREGLEWARAQGCGFMETSARECVNVEETFALIVRRVIEARRLHASPPSNQQSLSPLPSGSAALPPRAAKATASSALADGTNGVMGDSFSRTRPLEPVWGNGKGGKERKRKKGEKEDGGVGNADGNGDGSEKGRGKGWMRLRCW